MLDFDKELPPSAVQKEELLLQIARDHFVTGLDEEVPGVVHLHVLLHPVREVSEENLTGRTTNKRSFSTAQTRGFKPVRGRVACVRSSLRAWHSPTD